MQKTQAGTPSPGGRRTWSEVWERSTARSRSSEDFLCFIPKLGLRIFSIEKYKLTFSLLDWKYSDVSDEVFEEKEESKESGDPQLLGDKYSLCLSANCWLCRN